MHISKSDFDVCNWQDVIEQGTRKECDVYSRLFFEKAKEAEEAGNTGAQEVFILLGGITSLIFKLDDKEMPFAPVVVWNDRRSFIVDDLTHEQLEVLAEIVPQVKDPEMRARIADVIWIKARNFRMAGLAVEAYLESATTLEDPVNWVQTAQRIERAVQIAATLGKKNHYYPKTIQHIERLLEKYHGEDPSFLSAEMMELLLEQRQGDAKRYASYAEETAQQAERNYDWHRARTYWEIRRRWFAFSGDTSEQYKSLEAIAETFLQEANKAVVEPNPRHMVAANHVQSAIETLRKIPDMQERIKELRLVLLEYQEKSLGEMGTFGMPFDVTKLQEKAREQVKGKTLQESLFALAFIGPSPRVESLRTQVIGSAKQFPFQALIPVVAVNGAGKTVGRRPSILSDEPDEAEQAIRAEMFRHAILFQQIHIVGFVEPAREQINLEHNIRVRDILPLVSNNPFVPSGREMIYARGISAGIAGDTLVAAHLLIPQLENSLRHFLSQNGCIVSKLDDNGMQDEFDLNRIFYDFWDELVHIFGEDTAFDLRGLLVERFGSNLRNEEAHGLMGYEDFFTPQISYVWWLALRLCYMVLIALRTENNEQQK